MKAAESCNPEHSVAKSSKSTNGGQDCEDAASDNGTVLVRDSKSLQAPPFSFDRTAWSEFLARL